MVKIRVLALAACLTPAFASGLDLAREVDLVTTGFNYSSGMAFDSGEGELSSAKFHARSFLSKPMPIVGDFVFAPVLQYQGTLLEPHDASPGFPIGDETLHYLALQGFVVSASDRSPWIYGAWTRAALSTDFQHVDGDDFQFDVAIGAAYRASDCLLLAFGVGVFELNGDERLVAGPAFSWQALENLKLSLYGHTFDATYNYGPDWLLSFRTEASGGVWNIEGTDGLPERLAFRSYLIGLHLGKRLRDSLWLDIGGGVSIANKLELGSPEGTNTFEDHPDNGWFVYAGLRVASW
jgi:hypothetical protein